MQICFLMYFWEKIDPENDTSLRLIHEAATRGHTVAITSGSSLTIRDNVAFAFCQVLIKSAKVSSNIATFYKRAQFRKRLLPLSGFDAIIMRDNPPLDPTVLNFLDSVKEDTFIMNDIDGLRIANNKLYTASFGDEAQAFIPSTHVSKNREYLERVLNESESGKMILKPYEGMQGHGVIVIEKSAKLNFRSLLDFYIGHGSTSGYVILQEYVEGAEQGDIRIIMLNGNPIGAMRRVPAENDVRANVHAGGTVRKHLLSKEEKQLCHLVGPKLVRDGLYLVGLDVINNKLIEVNVMSPGGIARINRLNRVRLQERVIDFVEQIISAKEVLAARKDRFRKAIEDANNGD